MAAARGGQVKRRNPFEDEVPLQLKVRVGPKQISDDKEMDMVYAYTKALLFRGANPDISEKRLQAMDGMNGYCNGTHILPQYDKENSQPRPLSCAHCKRRGSGVKCADCDRPVCGNCHQTCRSCDRVCCQYCIVLKYDEPQVKAHCLNCLSSITSDQ